MGRAGRSKGLRRRLRRRFRRAIPRSLKVTVAVTFALVALGILLIDPVLGAGVAAVMGWSTVLHVRTARIVRSSYRKASKRRSKKARTPAGSQPQVGELAPGEGARRSADWLEERLWAGFVTPALEGLEALSREATASPRARARAHAVVARWHAAQGDPEAALREANLSFAASPRIGKRTGAHRAAVRVDALNHLGRHEEALEALRGSLIRDAGEADYALRLANSLHDQDSRRDSAARLAAINSLYVEAGLAPLRAREEDPLSIDNLAADIEAGSVPAPVKVSVIVPAWNAERWLGTAIASIQAQTLPFLEIIVVDDCSDDETASIAAAFAESDDRLRLVRMPRRVGAYGVRNVGFQHSTGDLVTVHDADDWSHPQKLEVQASAIIGDAAVLASQSSLARASTQLEFRSTFGKNAVKIVTENFSSLMLRREAAVRLGEWDVVRAGGDSEFRRRFVRMFGSAALASVLPDVPLSYARVQGSSLTNGKHTGLRSQYFSSGARRLYRESTDFWHEKPSFLQDLPFRADDASGVPFKPRALRHLDGTKPPMHFDTVLMSDFGRPGGTTASNLAEVSAQHMAGVSTALLHVPTYDLRGVSEPMNAKVWAAVDRGEADLLAVGEEATCDVLVIRYPRAVATLPDHLPNVRPEHIVCVINQTPRSLHRRDRIPDFNIAQIDDELRSRYQREPTWFPIGPAVRQALEERHAEARAGAGCAGTSPG